MKREKARMKTLVSRPFRGKRCPAHPSKLKTPLETQILKNEGDAERLAPLLADAEIVVGHVWRAGFPPAPRLRLLQSVAAGLDLPISIASHGASHSKILCFRPDWPRCH